MALGVKLMGAFPVNAPETMARLQHLPGRARNGC
jgi:hypothetical protein